MSWLTDIAGKAEHLLNAMDRSAANALSSDGKPGKQKRRSERDTNIDTNFGDDHSESIKTLSSSSSNNGNGRNSKGHTRTSSFESIGSRESTKSSKSDKQAIDDEQLFEFLNTRDNDIAEKASTSSATIKDLEVGAESHPLRHDDYEGQMRSLTIEISNLNRRNIELETDCKRLQKRVANWQQQLGTSDSTIRELQSRESDLKASLDAKDSQIGVLKVRLQEVDQELQNKLMIIDKLEEINDSLKTASESNVSSANESFEEYRNKIRHLESELVQERDELKRIQTDSMAQIGRLEENQKSLVDEISILQRNFNFEKSVNQELEQRLKSTLKNMEDLKQDYAEFKLKASKTLQSKEEMIRAMNSSNSSSDSDEVRRVLQSQCDAMVLEIQELREKCESLKRSLDKIQNEDVLRLNSQIASLTEQLESERKLKLDLETDLKQINDESRYFQEDLMQTKATLTSRIEDRDVEIEKLRKQLVSKRLNESNIHNIEELETRIRNLTENLIQKQTLVEQLSSERHSLSLQLERSESRLMDLNSQKTGEVTIGIHHSPSFSNLVNRVKPLVEEQPHDGNVTRRVKRAYGQIDAFSIRLGNFLRAYPSARAAVLVYVLLLHVWVVFVLLYYEPEIHGPNFKMPEMRTEE